MFDYFWTFTAVALCVIPPEMRFIFARNLLRVSSKGHAESFWKALQPQGAPGPREWKRVHGLALKHKALNIHSASQSQWDDLQGVTNAGYDCSQR